MYISLQTNHIHKVNHHACLFPTKEYLSADSIEIIDLPFIFTLLWTVNIELSRVHLILFNHDSFPYLDYKTRCKYKERESLFRNDCAHIYTT
jgi:hypothetical protein